MGQAVQTYMQAEAYRQSTEGESLYSNPSTYFAGAGGIGDVLGFSAPQGTALYKVGNYVSGVGAVYGLSKASLDFYKGNINAFTTTDWLSGLAGTANFLYFTRFTKGIPYVGEIVMTYDIMRVGSDIYTHYSSSYTPTGYNMYNSATRTIPSGNSIPSIGNIGVVGSEFPKNW